MNESFRRKVRYLVCVCVVMVVVMVVVVGMVVVVVVVCVIFLPIMQYKQTVFRYKSYTWKLKCFIETVRVGGRLASAHAPGIPRTFFPAGKRSPNASRHVRDARAVMHAGNVAVFFEVGGGGKRSRHSRHMRNPQFHVSGKKPMEYSETVLYM